MKLLYPITGRGINGKVRLLIIVRNRCLTTAFSSGASAKAYLDLVHEGLTQTVMICDSASPAGNRNSLGAALTMIESGGVDLVITTDLSRISRSRIEVGGFFETCAENGVRVICFESHVDTADVGWKATLVLRELLAESLSSDAEEGGAACVRTLFLSSRGVLTA